MPNTLFDHHQGGDPLSIEDSLDEQSEQALCSLELLYCKPPEPPRPCSRDDSLCVLEYGSPFKRDSTIQPLQKLFQLAVSPLTFSIKHSPCEQESTQDQHHGSLALDFFHRHGTPNDQQNIMMVLNTLLPQVNRGGLFDATVCLFSHHMHHHAGFMSEMLKNLSWVTQLGQSVDNFSDTVVKLDRDIVAIQSCSFEVLSKAQTTHVVYRQLCQEMSHIQSYVAFLHQRLSYFDLQNTLTGSMGKNLEQYIIKLLTKHIHENHKKSLGEKDHEKETLLSPLESIFIQLEEGLNYFQVHSHFRHSSGYISGLKTLRSDLLLAARHVFHDLLETCETFNGNREYTCHAHSWFLGEKVYPRMSKKVPQCQPHYKRLKSVGQYLKPLIEVLRLRQENTHEPVYTECLNLMEGFYSTSRLRVLERLFRDELNTLIQTMESKTPSGLKCTSSSFEQLIYEGIEKTPLSKIIQQAVDFSVFLGRWEMEAFQCFFVSSHISQHSSQKEGLTYVLSSLANELVKTLRPFILSSSSLTELRSISDSLRGGFLLCSETTENPWSALRQKGLGVLVDAFCDLHKDLEESLTWKAEMFIEWEIKNYHFEPQELNYPAVLFRDNQDLPLHFFNISCDIGLDPFDDACAKECPTVSTLCVHTKDSPYSPPLLYFFVYCISTLPVLKPSSSNVLFKNALRSTIAALQGASGSLKNTTDDDAYLFLLRHLIKLRELVNLLHYTLDLDSSCFYFVHVNNDMNDGGLELREVDSLTSQETSQRKDFLTPKESRIGFHSFESLLTQLCEELVGYYSSLLVSPLVRLVLFLDSLDSSEKKTLLEATTCVDAMRIGVSQEDLITVEEDLKKFRDLVITTLPKMLLKLYTYLLPTFSFPHECVELPLMTLSPEMSECQLRSPRKKKPADHTLHGKSCNTNFDSLFSTVRTLVSVLRHTVLTQIKYLHAKLETVTFVMDQSPDVPLSVAFTCQFHLLQRWCTPDYLTRLWDALEEHYHVVLMEQYEPPVSFGDVEENPSVDVES